MDVILIKKSKRNNKKYDAIFKDKVVSFGSKGYSDFTLHKDEERKQRYIERHRKREHWGKDGVETAGFLSRWVLWNKPTLKESIKDANKKLI
jgi:hypothetical protein